MPAKNKMGVVVFFLVSVTFFVITTGILAIKEQEKTTRIRVEEELAQTAEELSETKSSLDTAKQEIDGLSGQLSSERTRAEDLAKKLSREKAQTQKLSSDLSDKVSKISSLETDLASKQSKVTSLTEEKEQIAIKLAQLGEEKNKLQAELTILRGGEGEYPSVDLGDISVSAMKDLKGSVLQVNQEFGFVIINIGAKDKITKGTVLFISRKDRFAGKIEVDRVFEDMCSANILKEWQKMNIKVGDRVKAL